MEKLLRKKRPINSINWLLWRFLEAEHMSANQMYIWEQLVEALAYSHKNIEYKTNMTVMISNYVKEVLVMMKGDGESLGIEQKQLEAANNLMQTINDLLIPLLWSDDIWMEILSINEVGEGSTEVEEYDLPSNLEKKIVH